MIEQRRQLLIQEFNNCGSWEEKYKHLIDLGKLVPKQEDELYQDKYLVKGCQSRVWLHAQLSEQGHVILSADSDAMITKGLASLLVRFYTDLKPQEILSAPPDFLKELGFQEHLSPSRANGFMSMIKQIQLYAQVFAMTELAKKN